MAEEKLFPYEVIGKDALLRHNHQDYREGDRVELTYAAAERNRWILKPLSDEGKFDSPDRTADPAFRLMRNHEQVEVLETRKAELQKQLERVEQQLQDTNEKIKQEQAARRPAPAGEKSATERPAPAVQAESKG